jgi:hypothetical protein
MNGTTCTLETLHARISDQSMIKSSFFRNRKLATQALATPQGSIKDVQDQGDTQCHACRHEGTPHTSPMSTSASSESWWRSRRSREDVYNAP